ncbi:MAG TPA: hypothetical protein VI583_10340 [Cyclobacteriaceae bacterium]|nr:hypothetical protein [Cyclobacteriaceae bacterium]
MRMKISDLSPEARVWIYQSDRILSESEKVLILERTNRFLDQWSAHGDRLKASAGLYYNTFLVISVEETEIEASGCSIDKSVEFVRQLERDLNINLLNREIVAFLNNDAIRLEPLNLIKDQIKAGKINKENIIFNNLVTTRREMDTNWKIPLKESWLKKYLPLH